MGDDLAILDSQVGAVLVRKHGGAGAISGGPYQTILTGPTERAGYLLVIVKPGERCIFYGSPTIRYLRSRS